MVSYLQHFHGYSTELNVEEMPMTMIARWLELPLYRLCVSSMWLVRLEPIFFLVFSAKVSSSRGGDTHLGRS